MIVFTCGCTDAEVLDPHADTVKAPFRCGVHERLNDNPRLFPVVLEWFEGRRLHNELTRPCTPRVLLP